MSWSKTYDNTDGNKFSSNADDKLTNNGEVIFKDTFTNQNGIFNNNGAVVFKKSKFLRIKMGQVMRIIQIAQYYMTLKDEVYVKKITNTENKGKVEVRI